MNYKIVSMILMLLMVLNVLPATFAADVSVNSNSTNDDDLYDDQVDFSGFSSTSKIAYEAVYGFDMNLSSFPGNLHTFGDVINFYKTKNLSSTAVNTSKNGLRSGDIVQMKNSDSTFLVYKGSNAQGSIVLEDLDAQYECSPQSFDHLFTGNAILINHSADSVTTINGAEINDNPIHDPTIEVGPMRSGLSTSGSVKEDWANAWQRQDFKDRSRQLVAGKTTNKDKVNAIFLYVRDAYNYHMHYDTKWSVNTVVNGKAGNCCELARMIYSLTKSAQQQGLLSLTNNDFRFIKANCNFTTSKYCGHVWVQFKVGPSKDPWQSADACGNGNTLGTHSGILNYVNGYIYSSNLDW
jgi:hypothetical protein